MTYQENDAMNHQAQQVEQKYTEKYQDSKELQWVKIKNSNTSKSIITQTTKALFK